MRVRLSKYDLAKLFNTRVLKGINLKEVAHEMGFSVRMLNDWKRGKYSLPYEAFKYLKNNAKLNDDDLSPHFLSDFWHISDAARKGAFARMKLHGHVATTEGRKAGGYASLVTHFTKHTGFKMLKQIYKPVHSESFAELMGILFGDGHVSDYQVGITTNSQTDKAHGLFIQKLMKDLFNITATVRYRKSVKAMTVIASSKALAYFLHSQGMPIGNKIKNNITVPKWIMGNIAYRKSFIRGLFDTDGCIYLDTHKHKNRSYRYLGWTITSYADKLIADVIAILKSIGLTPTHSPTQRSVYLRKQNEIRRYFKEVGTNNLKHDRRFKNFRGRVPKWS